MTIQKLKTWVLAIDDARQRGLDPNCKEEYALITEAIDKLSCREVSENYLQQVATEMLVADLRAAVAKASGDMQYATVIGVLHLMIQEVTDDAKSTLAP